MPKLLEKGYIYIAQPPLYQVKRKKREEYVKDDEALDKILIELGTEEVSLIRTSDKKSFTKAQLTDILKSLQELERYSRVVTRRGAKFENYLEQRDKKGKLPEYIVWQREGNDEQFHFLKNDDEVATFNAKANSEIVDEDENVQATGQNSKKTKVFEVYESDAIEKVLESLEKKGFETDHFIAQDKPIFEIQEGEGDKATKKPIFSVMQILNTVKEVARQGVQIKRFKGLGEMNAKELFETTMDPQKRQLLQVTLPDAAKADETFTILMGDEVEPRRNFIEENALNVRNLDV
jgi:DNA gyrase subunit B